MSTLKRILIDSRLRLGDLSVHQYPEALLLSAANEGKNDLVRLLRAVREDYFKSTGTGSISATTAPNTSEITLPTDFAELKTIEITNSGYEHIDFEPMDRADNRFKDAAIDGGDFNSGYGKFYYDTNSSGVSIMELSPGSDIALAYKVHYIKTIADMTQLEIGPTGIPAEFWDYVTTYVICEVLRSRGDERLSGYLDKLASQSVSIQGVASSRQIMHPKYVRGFMEDEEG
jgi:hypothetical protein